MTYPVIVLEGADCAGKSTLGEYLKGRWASVGAGAALIHATYRFPNQMFDYHTALLEKVLKLREHGPVILDRWWPSELIYADVFRGGSRWPMGGRMLDRVALKHGFIYVGCIPSDDGWHTRIFNERAEAGGEMYTRNEGVAAQYKQWHHRMSRRADYARYDVCTQGTSMGDVAAGLMLMHTMLTISTPAPFRNAKYRQVAGNPRSPLVMILGERSNPKGRHSVWPFFEHAHSSLWLTQALANAGLKEEQIAWYNVLPEDGDEKWARESLDTTYNVIKPHYLLALGRTAQMVCVKAGLVIPEHGYRALPHPSYVRRFQNGNMSSFIDMFQTMMKEG
jgi:hypothetical protein